MTSKASNYDKDIKELKEKVETLINENKEVIGNVYKKIEENSLLLHKKNEENNLISDKRLSNIEDMIANSSNIISSISMSAGHDDAEKKVPISLKEEMNNENIDNLLEYDSSDDKELDISNYHVNNRRSSGQFSAFMNQTPGPPIKNKTIYNEDEDDFKIEDIPEFKGIKLNNEKELDTKTMQGIFLLCIFLNL
jgi:hypothetical protein